MLKDTNKYEESAHFSYGEYKRKVKKGPNKDLMVFVSVFIIGVLIILGFAKILSPNVDVGIHVNDEISTFTDDDTETPSSMIDDRLRGLQMEDEGKKQEDEQMFSPELDERVVIPSQIRKTVGQMEAEKAAEEAKLKEAEHKQEVSNERKQETKQQTENKVAQQKPAITKAPSPATGDAIVNAKVVVGYYATEKQAEVAKTIIQDAGLNVTPIVKNLGGYYTLQVGSYSSREKAQQAANSLLKSNFPARVIVE
ncbi:MAG: SPOR domain-containing protein [Candidatus Gastranaerophilaceae bacterium]